MEQFKLRSIEELDFDFVSNLKNSSSADNNDEIISLIPEISKDEPEINSSENNENNNVISYFKKPAQQLDEEPAYLPQSDDSQKAPRPLVPIGQNKSVYSPVGAPEDEEENFVLSDETDYGVEVNKKNGKGALVGKIISIVLLAATVITFMLGCFVTIFLDNNGSNIGGMCFSTMSADVDQVGLSKGDLIISKKAEIGEYASGKMIAVPSVSENGCDIHVINYVNSISSEEAELSTTNITADSSYASSVMASSCLGIVNSYIPILGGLLTFAMENAILVCILFVLLSAFWCLLLVLIEKSASAPKTKKNQ